MGRLFIPIFVQVITNKLKVMELVRNEVKVKEYLEELSDEDLMQFYNEFASRVGYETIENNEDDFFDNNFSSTIDAVRAAIYGSYSFTDSYVQFDGQGNLETSNYVTDFLDLDQLASDAMDNPEDYDIEFIDINDFDEEELFDFLQENDVISYSDTFDEEEHTREYLEEIALDNDLT